MLLYVTKQWLVLNKKDMLSQRLPRDAPNYSDHIQSDNTHMVCWC